MALTAPQILAARRQVVATVFNGGAVNVTKAQIDASVAACVLWAENNAATINTAIAGTALASASATVKAQVFAIAIETRFGP